MGDKDEVNFETEMGWIAIFYLFFWALIFIVLSISALSLGRVLYEDLTSIDERMRAMTSFQTVKIWALFSFSLFFWVPSLMLSLNLAKYFFHKPLLKITEKTIWDARIQPCEIPVDQILSVHPVINNGALLGLRIKVLNPKIYTQSFYWGAFIAEAIYAKRRDLICISIFETKGRSGFSANLKKFCERNTVPLSPESL